MIFLKITARGERSSCQKYSVRVGVLSPNTHNIAGKCPDLLNI